MFMVRTTSPYAVLRLPEAIWLLLKIDMRASDGSGRFVSTFALFLFNERQHLKEIFYIVKDQGPRDKIGILSNIHSGPRSWG